MTEMQQRYENFLNAARKLAEQGKPVVPTQLMKEHRVVVYAFNVLEQLGYVKQMQSAKSGKRTIVWIPTTEIKKADAIKVLDACRKIQADKKREQSKRQQTLKVQTAVANPIVAKPIPTVDISVLQSKLSTAQVTINGTRIIIPISNKQIKLEVGNNKITIDM